MAPKSAGTALRKINLPNTQYLTPNTYPTMEILTDPKIAPLAWMLPLLAFSWVMFHQLTNNDDSHIWWVGLLSKLKLADKGTTDYEHPVNASKLIFKWLAIVAGILVLYQSFVVVQQYNPNFLGLGPKPIELTGTEGQPGKLPPRIPGAGGGGKSGASPRPSGMPQRMDAQETGQPGAIQPGAGSIQPGVQPGAPPAAPVQPVPGAIQPGAPTGSAGQPGAMQPGAMQPGGMQPGTPINPMGGPAGQGGGGQFNPALR